MRVVFVAFVFAIGCTSGPERMSNPTSTMNSPSVSPGLLLSDLPDWANSVERQSCRRNVKVRFLNLSRLNSSYGLSYTKGLRLQYELNRRFQESTQDRRDVMQEDRLFWESFHKIDGDVVPIGIPLFREYEVTWVRDESDLDWAAKRLKSVPSRSARVPVVMSACLGTKTLQSLVKKIEGLDSIQVASFGAEWFSVFRPSFKPSISVGLHRSGLFPKEAKVVVITRSGIRPPVNGKSVEYIQKK